jgi:catechol O-methyltransferase
MRSPLCTNGTFGQTYRPKVPLVSTPQARGRQDVRVAASSRRLKPSVLPALVAALGSGLCGVALARGRRRSVLLRSALWTGAGLGAAVTANELAGKPVPFLRWSVLRLVFGMKHLLTHWQVGDGREAALADYVVEHAQQGDVDDVIRIIDEFSRRKSVLINIGDEKGQILDRAVRRVAARRVLELGTYCGYGALRMARAMPSDGHVYSVELNADNAEIARRVIGHAGAGDRVSVVVGSLGDGGATIRRLREEHGFGEGEVDLVFVDHDKEQYLPDVLRILDNGWLHRGSLVVGDNIKVPGAPRYLAYLREQEGRTWRTTEHRAHVEYQSLLPDLVTESEYLGQR